MLETTQGFIECRYLQAKMINGNHIDISTEDGILIEAMYAVNSMLKSNKSISIGLLRGFTQAMSSTGDISVSGIDGSIHLLAHKGRIDLQINKLAMKSNSIVDATKGNIYAKLDPKLLARLSCQCDQYSTRRSVIIVSDTFQNDNNDSDNSAYSKSYLFCVCIVLKLFIVLLHSRKRFVNR